MQGDEPSNDKEEQWKTKKDNLVEMLDKAESDFLTTTTSLDLRVYIILLINSYNVLEAQYNQIKTPGLKEELVELSTKVDQAKTEIYKQISRNFRTSTKKVIADLDKITQEFLAKSSLATLSEHLANLKSEFQELHISYAIEYDSLDKGEKKEHLNMVLREKPTIDSLTKRCEELQPQEIQNKTFDYTKRIEPIDAKPESVGEDKVEDPQGEVVSRLKKEEEEITSIYDHMSEFIKNETVLNIVQEEKRMTTAYNAYVRKYNTLENKLKKEREIKKQVVTRYDQITREVTEKIGTDYKIALKTLQENYNKTTQEFLQGNSWQELQTFLGELLTIFNHYQDILYPLYKCPTLLKEKAEKRSKIIEGNELCFKCLRKHPGKPCPFGKCPYCGGPHNLVLCYKKERDEKNQKPQYSYDEDDWDKPSTSKN